MRHVLLYGPPAAGKLSVAKILAERHGMTLLDNHLSFDIAVRVFDFGTPEFNDLLDQLRTALFEATAAAGRDTVATLVFGHPADRPYVERLREMAARCRVDLVCVQLCPPPSVLLKRVRSASRLDTYKIRDPEALQAVLAQHDLYTPIDETDLRIDNSDTPPHVVATDIAAQLGLGRGRP